MLLFLILLPLLGAAIVFLLNENRLRSFVLLGVSAIHLGGVISLWRYPPSPFFGFLAVDALNLLVLSVVSTLFCVVSLYLIGYLSSEQAGSSRVFVGCLLLFLFSMTLVTLSQHLGLLWVGIEAITLSSAPLIGFHRSPQTIEATWKYLFICSVGISLALLGTLFLAVSASQVKTLFLSDLFSHASALSVSWLRLAVIFLLVGYGTKMGLAPMHTWLPDAHSEAPSPISALLSGALLNCAFLGILRVLQICLAAGQIKFAQDIMIVMGLLSLFVAAIFVLGQSDYKRMLAYSSVENMGILALGMGLGGIGLYGSLFHMLNNAFAKGMMFLVTGNLYQSYHSKKVKDIQGLLYHLPMTGMLFLLGFGAVVGLPPFGTFYSELMILSAALQSRRYLIAFFYILFLAIIFIGMAGSIMKMLHPGSQIQKEEKIYKENWHLIIPIIFLGLILLGLGMYLPSFLDEVLRKSSQLLGG